MKLKDIIKEEIEKIPEEYCEEVLKFIKELEKKKGLETAILSESSLKKDWLSDKEDEVWKNL